MERVVKITVCLFGSLRTVAGLSSILIEEEEGTNIQNLFVELCKMYPELSKTLFSKHRTDLILVNGVEIGNLDGLFTCLSIDSTVTLLPVVHGG